MNAPADFTITRSMVTLVRNELPLLFNSTVDEIGCAICGHIDVLRECVCVCMCVCVCRCVPVCAGVCLYVHAHTE